MKRRGNGLVVCDIGRPEATEGVSMTSTSRAKIIVNVNRHVIAANLKHGVNDPPISFRRGRGGMAVYAHRVEVVGVVTFVHDPGNPLPCGARVWAEVAGKVTAK